MEVNMKVLHYEVLDDENNFEFEIVTLEQAKDWLITFWWNNPNEEQSDDDLRELEDKIRVADSLQLLEYLGGVAYTIDEISTSDSDYIN